MTTSEALVCSLQRVLIHIGECYLDNGEISHWDVSTCWPLVQWRSTCSSSSDSNLDCSEARIPWTKTFPYYPTASFKPSDLCVQTRRPECMVSRRLWYLSTASLLSSKCVNKPLLWRFLSFKRNVTAWPSLKTTPRIWTNAGNFILAIMEDIFGVADKPMVVPSIHFSIDKKNVLVRKKPDASHSFVFQRTQKQITASNSIHLGSFGEHLSNFYHIGFEVDPFQ